MADTQTTVHKTVTEKVSGMTSIFNQTLGKAEEPSVEERQKSVSLFTQGASPSLSPEQDVQSLCLELHTTSRLIRYHSALRS